MDIGVRAIAPDEFESWMRGVSSAFSEHPDPKWEELERSVAELDRWFGAFDGDRIVGGASTASFVVSVPGGEVPMAGVTSVGVAPTHRRRGVASALMRAQLDQVRERGEPIAGLYASEGGIYRRYGYGTATFVCSMEIERERTAFVRVPPESGAVRLVAKEEVFDAVSPIYERVRAERPGMLAQSRSWWDLANADLDEDRDGMSALFYAVHAGPDGDDGFAAYRFKHEWPRELPEGTLRVEQLVATGPDAYENMWRYVFDIDLAARIKSYHRPPDDPLLWLLREPRRLQLTVRDGMWLRLVDVAASLEGRRYAADGHIVFEVRDDFCPWAEGRFRLEGGPDGATCARTDADPDLRMSTSELAASYLGGVTFEAMARAGLVDEDRSGALRTADGMFRWGAAPWCPTPF